MHTEIPPKRLMPYRYQRKPPYIYNDEEIERLVETACKLPSPKGLSVVKSDSVFCRIDGTPIKRFDRAWWATLREAGIKDFHFHDLRHTFCSNLIISGSGLKDAKEMIGHSDISMTDRYSHLTALHKRHRQEKLAEHYNNH